MISRKLLQKIGRVAMSGVGIALYGCSYHNCCNSIKPNVQLPRGFQALRGYDENDPDAHYPDGYPRYIYSVQDHMVMAYVPTQDIQMGGGTQPDEVPMRHVHVNHFYIDIHEVTNAQFDCFVRSAPNRQPKPSTGKCGAPKCYSTIEDQCIDIDNDTVWIDQDLNYRCPCFNPWKHREIKPKEICLYRQYWKPCLNNNHPVRAVSWRESWYYSRWTAKRLPSEAQWECAARGEDGRIYPWGNQVQSEVTKYLCNSKTGRDNWDGYEYTAPVMSYAGGVSPYGAFNMSGNVREWCGDNYDLGRYAYPSDEDPPSPLKRAALPMGDKNYPNPWDKDVPEARVGPFRGGERSIRGGSFAIPIERCRVDSRWAAGMDVHMNDVGFRCILPLPPEGQGTQTDEAAPCGGPSEEMESTEESQS